MIKCLKNPVLAGEVTVPGSKSYAHRMIICAALSKEKVYITNITPSADIIATVNCLNAMGADIKIIGNTVDITPIKTPAKTALCSCGESGSTLRFLLPIAAALGIDCAFIMDGRLPSRPMDALEKVLCEHGANITRKDNKMQVQGRLLPGDYAIPGNISSQYISGLEFALPLISGRSSIIIENTLESADYVKMTEDTLRNAKVDIISEDNIRTIVPGAGYNLRGGYEIEGDWSAAAVWICAAAMQKDREIIIKGLNRDSLQGDRKIVDIIKNMGAYAGFSNESLTVVGTELHAVDIDAAQIPDIIPALACACATANGKSHIYNAKRLRMKESDRISAIFNMLTALGADVIEESGGLIINGKSMLQGGTVDSFGDHRIAMAAALCALRCTDKVNIIDAESVGKSYPDFWHDWERLSV